MAKPSTRGRKPRGPYERNTTVLTVRMRPDLKAAIEARAKRANRSTSQEVMVALAAWLRQRDTEGAPYLEVMAKAIAKSASHIRQGTQRNWTTNDPAVVAAVHGAMEELLLALRVLQKKGGKQ
jgi:hypothetical protein